MRCRTALGFRFNHHILIKNETFVLKNSVTEVKLCVKDSDSKLLLTMSFYLKFNLLGLYLGGSSLPWQHYICICLNDPAEARCQAIQPPPGGSVQGVECSRTRQLPGTVCTLSCRAGYTQTGPPQRTCSSRGTWDTVEDTICVGRNTIHLNLTPKHYYHT